MREATLSEARAHLSALVTAAERQGRRTLILRHGKPVAAIVPLPTVGHESAERVRRGLSKKQIETLLAPLGRGRRRGAVADLAAGRT